MDSKNRYDEARSLIDQMRIEEAQRLLEEIISENREDDMAYYLLGNLFRKSNDWKRCIDCYSRAIELNPQSPALSAREMAISILNFYNTDMYNH